MIVLFSFEGQKTKVTINGITTEHRTTFLKKLSFGDVLEYVKSENKKELRKLWK